MDTFQQQYIDRLYVAANTSDDRGFIAFVVPPTVTPTEKSIGLKEALSSTTYSGSFVFSALAPVINNADDATAFVNRIYTLINKQGLGRAFVWLENTPNTAWAMGIAGDGTAVNSGLQAMLTDTLSLQVSNGMALSWQNDTTLLFNGTQGNYQIIFGGPTAPTTTSTFVGTLAFQGPLMGTIQFSMGLQRQSIYSNMRWGFQALYPDTQNAGATISEWLPLAGQDPGTDYLGFTINIDPTDVLNTAFDPGNTISGAYNSRRTWFNFTGLNADKTTTQLASFYRTIYGAAVMLTPNPGGTNVLPARLVFCLSENGTGPTGVGNFILSPEGDFNIQVPSVASGRQFLMGGTQGTEFFNLNPQTTSIRFLSGQPAYAPEFPFKEASPVKAPQIPDAPLLTSVFSTAWATLVKGGADPIYYIAQPKGSALFGADTLITPQYTDLFGQNIPGFILEADDTTTFPLLPYSGIIPGGFSQADVQNIESQVISPTRRKYVGQLSTSKSLTRGLRSKDADAVTQTSTTPSGLLATITTGAGGLMQWDEVLLGQNTDQGEAYALKFVDPDEQLIEALQTGDLLLVAANPVHLGDQGGVIVGSPAFQNKMGLGSWEMTASVGLENRYNDYRNVMIIKAKKGKLYNPDDPVSSLVANPSKWTNPGTFGSPSTLDPLGKVQAPDPNQLVILSQWLQSYFQQAQAQAGNAYFDKFNTIVTQDDWTGILFLRVDISALPENLAGIMAGVTDPDAFNAHHLAVEISPTKKSGQNAILDKPSSIFGLIYYVDPSFDDKGPQAPIAPSTNGTYDFRLLTLKVLFENTAVRSFESLAQLTITELLGMPVTKMGDPSNIYFNILLKGSLQINNDNTLYSLLSQGDNTFYFDNTIIHKIQVSNVLLSTLHEDSTSIQCWFGMSGFIDYYALSNGALAYDIFSFGNQEGEDLSNQGLKFNNLGIGMSFPVVDPQDKAMANDASQITFDTSHSTPRDNSLFLNFALDMQGLVTPGATDTPASLDYLQVIPGIPLSEVGAGDWYGLRLKLNMGTPGELAGKLSLDSYLLLAWSPDSNETGTYIASVGISLPGTGGGAKLISLQNIMKLSIGQIQLVYNADQSSFVLMLTEIALKFLGLLKIPPNGSTLFYLFGNPNAGGKASGLGWYAMYKQKKNALLQ